MASDQSLRSPITNRQLQPGRFYGLIFLGNQAKIHSIFFTASIFSSFFFFRIALLLASLARQPAALSPLRPHRRMLQHFSDQTHTHIHTRYAAQL